MLTKLLFFASRQTGKSILCGGAHAPLCVFQSKAQESNSVAVFPLLLLCNLTLHNGFDFVQSLVQCWQSLETLKI